MVDLTILSVSFGNPKLIELNRDLTQKLNPGVEFDWVVIDNSRLGNYEQRSTPHFKVYEGHPHILKKDKGSYHHALALNSGLEHIKTRYVLLLDHDFYVVRPHWIRDVLRNMESEGLAFFGSVWNPFWVYQYRYFPSVHFMLIDLKRVSKDELNFIPEAQGQWRWPMLWRYPFNIGRLKDTGYKIYKQFFKNRNYKAGLLTPYFLPGVKTGLSYLIYRKFHCILPDRLSIIPKKLGYFTTKSFMEALCPYGYESRWEEFCWRDAPVAFHLRNVGRSGSFSAADDFAALEELIKRLMS